MTWYDLISRVYDIGSAGSGGPRREAVAQLRLEPGDTVVDMACGTGLNFALIEAGIGQEGLLIGLDFSPGMLSRARRKVERNGWQNARLIQGDAGAVSQELLRDEAGIDRVDRVLCTLGLTVIPDWEQAFSRSWSLLSEGGRYAIMDWYVEQRNLFSWFLNSISQGDVSRATWVPLKQSAEDFSRQTFVRGNVFVAAGVVPATQSAGG